VSCSGDVKRVRIRRRCCVAGDVDTKELVESGYLGSVGQTTGRLGTRTVIRRPHATVVGRYDGVGWMNAARPLVRRPPPPWHARYPLLHLPRSHPVSCKVLACQYSGSSKTKEKGYIAGQARLLIIPSIYQVIPIWYPWLLIISISSYLPTRPRTSSDATKLRVIQFLPP
jgi:hypothetical protein